MKNVKNLAVSIIVHAAMWDHKMGKAVIIYSLRPEGPETDLNAILEEVKKVEFFDIAEEKDFMFGMKQLFVTFIYPDEIPEGKGPEATKVELEKISGIQSINQEALTLI